MRANKGFLQLRRLEAARDIATLLASSGNKVMLDSQSLLLNGMSVRQLVPVVLLMRDALVAGDDAKELLQMKK